MPRVKPPPTNKLTAAHRQQPLAGSILEAPDSSLLDLLDRLLDKGVMANGDLTLGVAGVDLIYVRLSALLCAADRILPRKPGAGPKRSRHRRPLLRDRR
jgi:hypothetical protein